MYHPEIIAFQIEVGLVRFEATPFEAVAVPDESRKRERKTTLCVQAVFNLKFLKWVSLTESTECNGLPLILFSDFTVNFFVPLWGFWMMCIVSGYVPDALPGNRMPQLSST